MRTGEGSQVIEDVFFCDGLGFGDSAEDGVERGWESKADDVAEIRSEE
jgi:hypothetical protein